MIWFVAIKVSMSCEISKFVRSCQFEPVVIRLTFITTLNFDGDACIQQMQQNSLDS